MNVSPEMATALSGLGLLLVTTITLAVTLVVRPWIQAQGRLLRERHAKQIARRAVRWVEQTVEPGETSREKRQRAWECCRTAAQREGLAIDDHQWPSYIEEAVHDLRLAWDAVGAPPLAPLATNASKRARGADGRFVPGKRR